MKPLENNSVRKGILILFALALFANSINASMLDDLKCKNRKAAIAMLIEGIKSDNIGLMKSAAFLAGKYRVKETVPALIEKLNSNLDDNCKVLIALSLFMIGSEEGIEAVFNLASSQPDSNLNHIYGTIYNEFVKSVDINDPFISSIVDAKR